MHFSKVAFDDRSVVFDVSGTFLTIRPVEDSYSGKIDSGTVGAMRWFISQSVVDMIEVTGRMETAVDDNGHTIDAID